jgi:hypothetical protein
MQFLHLCAFTFVFRQRMNSRLRMACRKRIKKKSDLAPPELLFSPFRSELFVSDLKTLYLFIDKIPKKRPVFSLEPTNFNSISNRACLFFLINNL